MCLLSSQAKLVQKNLHTEEVFFFFLKKRPCHSRSLSSDLRFKCHNLKNWYQLKKKLKKMNRKIKSKTKNCFLR